eukprot:scaffold2857_cov344-Pavlova_lutheri.AAC.25
MPRRNIKQLDENKVAKQAAIDAIGVGLSLISRRRGHPTCGLRLRTTLGAWVCIKQAKIAVYKSGVMTPMFVLEEW